MLACFYCNKLTCVVHTLLLYVQGFYLSILINVDHYSGMLLIEGVKCGFCSKTYRVRNNWSLYWKIKLNASIQGAIIIFCGDMKLHHLTLDSFKTTTFSRVRKQHLQYRIHSASDHIDVRNTVGRAGVLTHEARWFGTVAFAQALSSPAYYGDTKRGESHPESSFFKDMINMVEDVIAAHRSPWRCISPSPLQF